MLVSATLYKNKKLLLVSKYYEDLEEFVEELKRLNPKYVDRRDFIVKMGDEVMKTWGRK